MAFKLFNLNHKMKLKELFRKIWDSDRKKEDLYTKILLWAHNKQESGFTWEEMKQNFGLNSKWFASISLFLTAIGLFFTIKQTNLAETQGISERIIQARSVQSAVEFCKQNPDSQVSGLYEISTGKSASCAQVIRNYSGEYSWWDKVRSFFK